MAIVDQIVAEAQRQGVDPALALEVAQAESSLNPGAIGDDGKSIGLFQLKLSTAAALGVDPYDVAQNIQGGISYLRQLLAQFGDPAKALAAYNCGPSCVSAAVSRYAANWFTGIPASTQGYVNKILGNVQTAYTPAFNPAAAALPGAGSGVLNIPPSFASAAPPSAAGFLAAPAADGSLWSTLAVAVALILGIGFVLSES